MKFTVLIAAALAAAPIPEAAAHPGMGETIKEIERIAARSWGGSWGGNKGSNGGGPNSWTGQGNGGPPKPGQGNGGGSSWPGQNNGGQNNGGGSNSWSGQGSGGGSGSGSGSWPGQSNGGGSNGGGGSGWSGDNFDAHSLIGDLVTISDKSLTSVGSDIKKILQGNGNPTSRESYIGCPSMNSQRCKRDTCCVWQYISNELQEQFRGEAGRCTRWARYAVRIGFHDAGTWSLKTASQGGGADGSIVLSNELSRGENLGLQQIGDYYQTIYDKYHTQYGFTQVTMADLIQMGANIAAVTCPLGPRVRSFVGRKDNKNANPNGLLPNVNSDALTLINLFKDKTIGPDDLVALIGAHTTSQQHFTNPQRAGDPQDSTPGVWDILFYQQTISPNAPPRVYKFASDVALANHPITKPAFQAFASGSTGQAAWNQDYARAYVRLSLLGVNNINDLTECTKVLPQPTDSYRHKDQSQFSKWLQSDDNSWTSKSVSKDIDDGYTISTPADKIPSRRGPWKSWTTPFKFW
ncbi:Manganese peroxidase 2 [Fusarium austroafricanum]|uniref:Peroxidase n=1 Tax=Fusarium austroafricanum TaxID=2364996 RepID=A0A8H4KYX3_9HYPO|nr:Manganese peroxidase 2 [Fusarium austroafricanum]